MSCHANQAIYKIIRWIKQYKDSCKHCKYIIHTKVYNLDENYTGGI